MSRHKHILDAAGAHPGRLATQIATLLMGKHKATYELHHDHGDKVAIQNAAKILFSGKKLDQKDYKHHSMHPGGLKVVPAKKVLAENPEKIIYHAVSKMLPKNKLRRGRLKRLTFI